MHFLHYEYKDHRYNTLNLTSAMCTKQHEGPGFTGVCEKGNDRRREEKRRHLLISLNYCSLDSSERLFFPFVLYEDKKTPHEPDVWNVKAYNVCGVPFSVGVFYNVVLSTQPLIRSVNDV